MKGFQIPVGSPAYMGDRFLGIVVENGELGMKIETDGQVWEVVWRLAICLCDEPQLPVHNRAKNTPSVAGTTQSSILCGLAFCFLFLDL